MVILWNFLPQKFTMPKFTSVQKAQHHDIFSPWLCLSRAVTVKKHGSGSGSHRTAAGGCEGIPAKHRHVLSSFWYSFNTPTIHPCQRQGISLAGSSAILMQKACVFLYLYSKRKNHTLLDREGRTGKGRNKQQTPIANRNTKTNRMFKIVLGCWSTASQVQESNWFL